MGLNIGRENHDYSKLDPDSRAFVFWVDGLMSKWYIYYSILFITLCIFLWFILTTRRHQFRLLLHDKLYIGGIEHGKPSKYSFDQIFSELQKEFLDIAGWFLVAVWGWKHGKK